LRTRESRPQVCRIKFMTVTGSIDGWRRDTALLLPAIIQATVNSLDLHPKPKSVE